VAGVAAAFTNNAKGIAGINYAAPILSARTSSSCTPQYAATIEAIYYAVNNGASVITASWGFLANEMDVSELHDAVAYAWNNNIPLIAASGNSNLSDFNYLAPARWYKVITVGGSDQQDRRWSDSLTRGANYGDPGLDVSAPSVSMRVPTADGSYYTASGTSFAVPQVAGVVGLLKALYPNISSQNIKNRLWNAADKVGGYNYSWRPDCGGQSPELGCGRLNALDTID
jgi:subtilisin family serine protease